MQEETELSGKGPGRDPRGGGAHRLPNPFAGAVLYPEQYVWLVFVSALDVMFTIIILYLGGSEVNPIADYLLESFNIWGLIGLKFLAISVAMILCELVGRVRYSTGYNFVIAAIALSALPVILGLAQLIVFGLHQL